MGNQVARHAHKTKIEPGQGPAERNDRWLTPPDIVAALGDFDLDPCGAPGHVLARETYLLENDQDGLALPWFGRVWMNPPYGRYMRPWIERFAEHNFGTMLVPASTGIKLWQDIILPRASAIHFYRHRIGFLRRDDGDSGKMVSPQASAIVAFGPFDAKQLEASDLPGFVVTFEEEEHYNAVE